MPYWLDRMDKDFHHLGWYAPYLKKKPSEYLRMMYLDTVAYHAPAIECAIKTVGADRLIFGTDSPMLVALKQRGHGDASKQSVQEMLLLALRGLDPQTLVGLHKQYRTLIQDAREADAASQLS